MTCGSISAPSVCFVCVVHCWTINALSVATLKRTVCGALLTVLALNFPLSCFAVLLLSAGSREYNSCGYERSVACGSAFTRGKRSVPCASCPPRQRARSYLRRAALATNAGLPFRSVTIVFVGHTVSSFVIEEGGCASPYLFYTSR